MLSPGAGRSLRCLTIARSTAPSRLGGVPSTSVNESPRNLRVVIVCGTADQLLTWERAEAASRVEGVGAFGLARPSRSRDRARPRPPLVVRARGPDVPGCGKMWQDAEPEPFLPDDGQRGAGRISGPSVFGRPSTRVLPAGARNEVSAWDVNVPNRGPRSPADPTRQCQPVVMRRSPLASTRLARPRTGSGRSLLQRRDSVDRNCPAMRVNCVSGESSLVDRGRRLPSCSRRSAAHCRQGPTTAAERAVLPLVLLGRPVRLGSSGHRVSGPAQQGPARSRHRCVPAP